MSRARTKAKPKAAPKRKPASASRQKPSEPGLGAELARGAAKGVGQGLGALGGALGRGLAALFRSRDVQRLAAIGVLAGTLGYTSILVRERVEGWERFRVQLGLRADAPPPPGLSPDATRDLAAIRLPEHVTAFHTGVVPSLAKHLDALPWVASVEELRLVPPAALELKLRTHRPLAQLGQGGVLVAAGGALIPRRYGAHPDRLPRLIGAGRGDARALEAGVQVLQALGPLAAQVEAVDLRNLDGRQNALESEVVLRLAGGVLVDWGRCEPIGPAVEGELALGRPRREAEAKRKDLEAFLSSFPQAALVERVSLRFDEVTYTLRSNQPLSRR